MKRVHLVISGKVQGVFFRQSSLEFAIASGADGWVRNRLNGTVELVAQGEPEKIDRLVTWCHSGPDMASVSSVEVTIVDPIVESEHFHIRPTA